MALIIHVVIALLSIVFTTWLWLAPSPSKLPVSYILVALTLTSGTYLVISNPAQMLHTCVMGLAYLGIISVVIISARHKLARQKS